MRFGTCEVVACLLCLTGVGCDESSSSCTRPSDCPAGQTCSDGRCLPVLKGDAGRPEGGLDGLSPGDLAPKEDSIVWPDTGIPDGGCFVNNNGKIEREELPIVVPTSVTYVLGETIEVNLAGVASGGKTVWDLTASAQGDHQEPLALANVPAWAAQDFPNATYVSLLNKDLDTYGVFLVKQDRMELVGAISGQPDHGVISYSTPVELLRFPIAAGDSYTSKTYGTGTWGFTPIANWETYTVDVLGSGELKLPKLTLPVVLVRTTVEQYLYGNPFLNSTWTLFLFISECYGTVARVVVDGDPGTDLTKVMAEERWRLATP